MMKTAIKHKSRRFRRFLRVNEAVSALEYAILVGVIAVAIGVALTAFGGQLTAALNKIGVNVNTTAATAGGGSVAGPAPAAPSP